MHGIIEDGYLVEIAPISGGMIIGKGDVVLCRIGGNDYLHKVVAKRGDLYQIGNNLGHVNGWTKQVFGVCVSVSGKETGGQDR